MSAPSGPPRLQDAIEALRTSFGYNPGVRAWLADPSKPLDPASAGRVNALLANYGLTAQDIVNAGSQKVGAGGNSGGLGQIGNAIGGLFSGLGSAVNTFAGGGQGQGGGDLATRVAQMRNIVGQSGGGGGTLPGGGDYGLTPGPGEPVTGFTGGGGGVGGAAGRASAAVAEAARRTQGGGGKLGGNTFGGPTGPPVQGGAGVAGLGLAGLGQTTPWASGYGGVALQQPDLLTDEAMRQLGYNPLRLGTFGEALRDQLDPIIKAQAGMLGYDPATAAADGSNAPDYAKMQGWLGGLAKSFVTPGVDAYGQVRAQAGGLAGNQGLRADMNDLNDPDTLGLVNDLTLLSNAGSSGLHTAATNQRLREFGGLKDLLGRQGYLGTMMDYLNQRPEDDDFRRRLTLLTGMR